MAFFENKIIKKVNIGGIFRCTFKYDGDNNIRRVNPLCNCIKSSIEHPNYTFWYKVKNSNRKIVVITYDDESKDFLEMQAIQ